MTDLITQQDITRKPIAKTLAVQAGMRHCLLGFGLMLASTAFALDPPSNKAREAGAAGFQASQADQWLMAKYDSNGDREISVDEISRKRQKMFAYLDDNNDGQVSLSEYELLDIRKRALIVKARFSKLDANADGKLTGAEYIEYYGAFGAFDLDGDGRITPTEMSGAPVGSTQEVTLKPKCFWGLCLKSSL